jgi:hypothetical protein
MNTEAYAFLNIKSNPLTAWATYRGQLVSAPLEPGFLSVWSASLMRMNDPARIRRELTLEKIRASFYPDRVSRLRGMFCFLSRETAGRAADLWGDPDNHFRPECLAELSLAEAGTRRDRLDANWIANLGEPEDIDRVHLYWRGEAYPDDEPIWETLVGGRLTVLGIDLRNRAYEIIKRRFPDSLMFLEISRQAVWVGSDLGNICGFLLNDGDDLELQYYMDMRDAEDPSFLAKLENLASGHPINWADMAPHIGRDSFGNTPDLRRFGFRCPKVDMPYVGHHH